MSARLLMIALDGADGQLLDRCSADGSLPNIAALRARGRVQRLSAPQGITDDAIWASFQYGVDVGEHGRYHFSLARRDGRIGRAHWDEQDRLAFWDVLSNEGKRVAVIDIPKCRNPRPLNGFHLVDWLVHGRYFPKPRSQPRSLAADVVKRFGPAPPSECGYWQHDLCEREIADIHDNLRAGVALKRAAGLHYLACDDWDLFVIGFKEAHCASHTFFDFDPRHPAFDPVRKSRIGDPMMSILRDIDRAIGDLEIAAGPSAELVVFSPSDFQANGSFDHLMPGIVECLNARLSADTSHSIEQAPVRQGLQPVSPASEWQCTIMPYNENCVALRVARQGACPSPDSVACCAPESHVLRFIEDHLWSLRDAGSGQNVVSAITRPSSELEGSRMKFLPDLLVHCTRGLFPSAVVSPTLGRFEGERPKMRPGNHVAGGLAIAAGGLLCEAFADVRTMADLGSLPSAVLTRSP